MRKLGLVVGLFLIGFMTFGIYHHAAAASGYGGNGSCSDDFDFTHFPYRFLCGSANADNANATFYDSYIKVVNNRGNDATLGGSPQVLPTMNSIDFTVGLNSYTNSRNAPGSGERAPVLIWTYVLPAANRSILGNGDNNPANDISPADAPDGTPGHVIACPGDGSDPGKVYNYRGTLADNTTASPAAFDGTYGVENCGDHGDVVYWYLKNGIAANTQPRFKFTLNLNTTTSGNFCVRENISVGGFPGTLAGSNTTSPNTLFPPAGAVQTDQDYVANHVAKQSHQYCYQTTKQKTTPNPNSNIVPQCGYFNNNPLDTIRLSAHDATRQTKYYRVFKDSVNEANAIAGGSFGGYNGNNDTSAGVLMDGPGLFGDGNITRTLILKTYATFSGGVYSNATGQDSNTGELNCIENDPSTGFTASCTSITFNNLQDQDAQYSGQQVPYFGAVYAVVPNGNINPTPVTTISGNNSGTFTVNFAAPPGTNSGYYIDMGATNIRYDGSSGQFGYVNRVYVPPCYQASCSVTVVGNIPGRGDGNVLADSDFTVYVDVTNTSSSTVLDGINNGNLRLGVGGYQQNNDGSFADYPQWNPLKQAAGDPSQAVNDTRMTLGRLLYPGQTSRVTFTAHAPNAITSQQFRVRMVLENQFWFGSSCDAPNASGKKTIDVYKPFTIKPTAFINPDVDDENPTTITYTTGGSMQGPIPVTADSYSSLHYKPVGTADDILIDGEYRATDTYGDVSHQQPRYNNRNPIRTGDQYCPVVKLLPGKGNIGPGGDVAGEEVDFEGSCLTVIQKPYVKVYGGDISVGSCDNTPKSISGWSHKDASGVYHGAGSQFAAFVHGTTGSITGFATAVGTPLANTDYAQPPTGLSFANSTKNISNELYGGALGGGSCLPTMTTPIDAMPLPAGSNPVTDAANPYATTNGGEASIYKIKPATGTLDIEAAAVGLGTNTTLYVDGDVYIKGNITAVDGSTTVAQIPNFTLIATGNIYISKDVTSLYGNYIAQPKSGGTKGAIYTCNDGSGSYTDANQNQVRKTHFDDCNSQLRVYGTFTAKKVYLLRTWGSQFKDTDSPRNTVPGAGDTNAAEVFLYNPLLWIHPAETGGLSGSSSDTFDAITTLPPVL